MITKLPSETRRQLTYELALEFAILRKYAPERLAHELLGVHEAIAIFGTHRYGMLLTNGKVIGNDNLIEEKMRIENEINAYVLEYAPSRYHKMLDEMEELYRTKRYSIISTLEKLRLTSEINYS